VSTPKQQKSGRKCMRTIETKTARSKLPVSKVPVFVRLGQGVSIGYRRNAGGAGVWIVRLADGKRGKTEKRLAQADDLAPADGRNVMDFQQAAEAARRLARGETEEANPAVLTLNDAIDAYKADLIARRAGVDNVSRLLFNLTPAMLKRPIALLDVTELRKWRDATVKRMAPASVNRLVTILKAVLNLAASKDERLSARPWEIGLASLPEATSARNVVLPAVTIRRLVVDAAPEQSHEFGLLVEALALTGARVSQLARCRLRDLVGERLMIPSSAKGQNKRASSVPVPISPALADRLRITAVGRSATDSLFVKPSGEPWRKSDHARPFARAVMAIGEDPDIITSYALRHSHITAQLLAGLPVQLVAKLHDTSASQIEKHYAAAIASHTDELVRGAMMNLDTPAQGVVVPLRSGGEMR
jgi:integrase